MRIALAIRAMCETSSSTTSLDPIWGFQIVAANCTAPLGAQLVDAHDESLRRVD
jgi:hypothetical protein